VSSVFAQFIRLSVYPFICCTLRQITGLLYNSSTTNTSFLIGAAVLHFYWQAYRNILLEVQERKYGLRILNQTLLLYYYFLLNVFHTSYYSQYSKNHIRQRTTHCAQVYELFVVR